MKFVCYGECPRGAMDSTSDSGSENVGSTPAEGATQMKKSLCLFVYKQCDFFSFHVKNETFS